MAPRVAHVAVRVDASARMGTGHLKRCLALAQALQSAGAAVHFVVRPIDAVAAQVLSGTPWPVHWLSQPGNEPTVEPLTQFLTTDGPAPPTHADEPPHAPWAGVGWTRDARETITALQTQQPDWLVLDHYAFDARWHQAVTQALGSRLLVIDDTADRSVAADALLDQNWHADHRLKYAGRVRAAPRWLCGPRFALLGTAYRDAPRHHTQPAVRSIGIFMGGTDPGGISARVLASCREAGFAGEIEVASTSANPHLADLQAACASVPPTTLLLDAPNLAAFFARHGLQIGAGGGATWERCCIGAPTIALALADNQTAVVPALAGLGALRAASLPSAALADAPLLVDVLRELLQDAPARTALAERAAALVDGRGAQRVALSLLAPSLQVRPARLGDAQPLHHWRNHPAVRAVSIQGEAIAWPSHLAWLGAVLAAPDRWLFMGEVGAVPVGSIRWDRTRAGELTVSLSLDPDLLGLGLGPHLLLAGEQAVASRLGSAFTALATVLPGNTASQRLFEVCGYQGGPLQYSKTIEPHSGECHENS
jgi:UDP-2,4-diacetamido-2,4,6-trideoxy-beta-L-altropyranose hydrolase